ncbi:MAG: ABC transporter permease [Planctomycetaceae bacterium]
MSAPIRRLLSDYGMLVVLVLLGLVFSGLTLQEQAAGDAGAARRLAEAIRSDLPEGSRVLVAVRDTPDETALADALVRELGSMGLNVVGVAKGEPRVARAALERLAMAGTQLDAIAATKATSSWLVFTDVPSDFPPLGTPRLYVPSGHRWPSFLKADNLLNIANQIAVIAIIAIGMTMVIIAGGIDLSVGSLAALSAVLASRMIRDHAGGVEASAGGMVVACLVAIGLCGLIGTLTGGLITGCGIPPFIVTLAMMLVASGIASILSEGQSIYQIPESFVWLGRGADLFGLPNAVVLMLVLYGLAHVLMSRTTLGRYLYAVGGNREAARLSGVPVQRVLLFAYAASGLLAGLGGVIMASQLKSGSPTYGAMYELYVIAAVVVGGTALAGGEGKILGTLIGAFIIAVIQNGMNLTNIESYTQKVVLGLVILAAVLVDRLRRPRP